ncbi:MAG TPA: hypothetical protein VFT65_17935 [Candidatus Angelobacter sp.]|nr:hypothetical protein [Candidatus Angelobacter sp.]
MPRVIVWLKDRPSASDAADFRPPARRSIWAAPSLRRTFILLLLLAPGGIAAAGQSAIRTIHVFVALADNKSQGIVPVAAVLGNGDDPQRNLYWGSAYGVKTYFARNADWQLVSSGVRPKPEILERCIFRHRTQNVYLVADAYRGNRIQQAIIDFLEASAGGDVQAVSIESAGRKLSLNAGGGADLLAYAGHDGLMDFRLSALAQRRNDRPRDAIILACISKSYFAAALRATGAHPLIWTTGLMAPEAYTLKSAIDGWMAHESGDQVRERAAAAYSKYQKCGIKGARRLLVTGW